MIRSIKNPALFVLVTISFLILLIPSCESLRKDPEFIGTWQFTEKITSDDLVFNTTRTLILTENSYEETYTIQRENSAVISSVIGTKGNLRNGSFKPDI